MNQAKNAYTEAVKKLQTLSPEDVVLRSGAICRKKEGFFLIRYFAREYTVSLAGRVTGPDGSEPPFNDRALIVQYLCSASGLPPRGRWLSFLELPEGSHHYAPFQTDATIPLARRFGRDREGFSGAARFLGGTPLPLGDAGFSIPAFPRLPLAVILWEGDEEFEAKTNILFDAAAPASLSTAALWVLGVEMARKMLGYRP
ncbi:MAG: DUF3786 domain-containing protein [Desulfotomaculales bacterium]